MPLVATDAIVLHILDYSETSRILRLATRDAGVVSVIARGARRSRSRFGSALDLFAEGTAHLILKEGRDLQTLTSFEVVRSHPELGADLHRFTSAAVVAEMILRFGTEEGGGREYSGDAGASTTYDALSGALAVIAAAPPEDARESGLAGVWRIVADLGFAPALDVCAVCHQALPSGATLTFSTDAGGVLCASCARLHPAGRMLPAEARSRILVWCRGERSSGLDEQAARAHQRLLREFLAHHVADGRNLRAFDAWERDTLSRT